MVSPLTSIGAVPCHRLQSIERVPGDGVFSLREAPRRRTRTPTKKPQVTPWCHGTMVSDVIHGARPPFRDALKTRIRVDSGRFASVETRSGEIPSGPFSGVGATARP